MHIYCALEKNATTEIRRLSGRHARSVAPPAQFFGTAKVEVEREGEGVVGMVVWRWNAQSYARKPPSREHDGYLVPRLISLYPSAEAEDAFTMPTVRVSTRTFIERSHRVTKPGHIRRTYENESNMRGRGRESTTRKEQQTWNGAYLQ